jgi:hypothetical protein
MNHTRFLALAAFAAIGVAGVIAQAASAAAAPPTPSARLFAALDADHDQAISAPEFAAGFAELQRAIAVGLRLREQFRTVDADHSNAIEDAEYARLALVRQAGASAPALSAFDANGDRKLGFAEYVALVRTLAARPAAPAGG